MKSSYRAFSLPEVLAVIAVLSVISCSVWGERFVRLYQNWQVAHVSEKQIRNFLTLLEHARLLAIRSSQAVWVCGGKQCQGDWSEGIYLQQVGDQPALQSYHFEPNTHIQWHGFPVFRSYIEFLPTGLSSYQNGSFYLCVEQAPARRIIINQSGRAYLDTREYQTKECL